MAAHLLQEEWVLTSRCLEDASIRCAGRAAWLAACHGVAAAALPILMPLRLLLRFCCSAPASPPSMPRVACLVTRATDAAHLAATAAASSSRFHPPSRLFLSHPSACSKELILQLMLSVNSAAALAALPMVTLTADAVGEAIAAAASRRSLRGVRALLAHAREAGLAAGPDARSLWRAAIVAFGALGRPSEARGAFVGMRQAGAWEQSDTPTVNLLLNALACDISVQFTRCAARQRWQTQPAPPARLRCCHASSRWVRFGTAPWCGGLRLPGPLRTARLRAC